MLPHTTQHTRASIMTTINRSKRVRARASEHLCRARAFREIKVRGARLDACLPVRPAAANRQRATALAIAPPCFPSALNMVTTWPIKRRQLVHACVRTRVCLCCVCVQRSIICLCMCGARCGVHYITAMRPHTEQDVRKHDVNCA